MEKIFSYNVSKNHLRINYWDEKIQPQILRENEDLACFFAVSSWNLAECEYLIFHLQTCDKQKKNFFQKSNNDSCGKGLQTNGENVSSWLVKLDFYIFDFAKISISILHICLCIIDTSTTSKEFSVDCILKPSTGAEN